MRKLHLFIFFFYTFLYTNAQTGIGTPTPDASAKLDVYSTNKGFLPPRVTLTSSTDNTTIQSPATGLLVYNTGNNAGLVAGYYYWNGSSWATIANAQGSGVSASFIRGSRSAAQTGLTNGGTVIFTQVDNTAGQEMSLNTSTGQITLAAGRTYRLIAQVPNYQTSSADARLQLAWYNETSGAYIGSTSNAYPPGSGASYGATAGLSETIITTTTTTVISYRIVQLSSATQLGGSSDFPVAGSYPWFEGQVISGNTAVNGQSVDYIQASLSTNQALSAAGNINFNTSSGTGISITSGGFNLIANKTYKLEAALGGASTGYGYYAWVDNANTILPGGSIGVVMKAGSAFTDAPQDKAIVYYTPTVNTTVFLRVINVSGTITAYAPSAASGYSSSWASIQQIGSSAIINPWTLSGTNTFNTTGNVGIGTSSPTTKLDVNGTASANTLSLSNVTIGTPSLVLKNGDAAATYSDVAQVKMGWSGSATGKSQYAQFIHSRHNSGTTGNAIDIYLSDGTADNTIATGSTKAMSIESPGNLTVAGKINLTDASGNVAVKAAGFVNAGTAVTLGDIQVQMSTSGSRSLQIRTTGSSFTGMASAHTTYSNGSYTYYSDKSFTVDANYGYIGGVTWSFGTDGDLSVYYVRDTTNQRFYRLTLMVGNVTAYTNNFISIERLL